MLSAAVVVEETGAARLGFEERLYRAIGDPYAFVTRRASSSRISR
jgi:hypothetical protein